jgi:hypothetical protein
MLVPMVMARRRGSTQTADTPTGLRRRARRATLFAVLGLHLLGYLLLQHLLPGLRLTATVPWRAPLQVWLLDSEPRPAQPGRRDQPAPAVRPAQRIRPASPPEPSALPSAAPVQPQAITAPELAAPQTTGGNAAPAASGPPAPLDLRLPPGALQGWRERNPALDDARSNSARATLEDRIGAAMDGAADWTEERIDQDHIRFRHGHRCLDVHRSRDEQLDSFNRSVSPKPWATDGMKPC